MIKMSTASKWKTWNRRRPWTWTRYSLMRLVNLAGSNCVSWVWPYRWPYSLLGLLLSSTLQLRVYLPGNGNLQFDVNTFPKKENRVKKFKNIMMTKRSIEFGDALDRKGCFTTPLSNNDQFTKTQITSQSHKPVIRTLNPLIRDRG